MFSKINIPNQKIRWVDIDRSPDLNMHVIFRGRYSLIYSIFNLQRVLPHIYIITSFGRGNSCKIHDFSSNGIHNARFESHNVPSALWGVALWILLWEWGEYWTTPHLRKHWYKALLWSLFDYSNSEVFFLGTYAVVTYERKVSKKHHCGIPNLYPQTCEPRAC